MKATLLLRRDHETIRSLIAGLGKARNSDRAGQFKEMCEEILAHAKIEEDLFYSELGNVSSETGHELVAQAVTHHMEMERQLNDMTPDVLKDGFDDQLAVLLKQVENHFRFEEEEMFEEARQHISEYRMEELGLEMEDRRRFLRLSAA